ncbi:hypothetical protein KSZ_56120 [Dictyobacter formicarum]|uniref:Uncharacterized protein n=1 Tax=Dictyobacter formicarum TaxID=2778368 RepID=A0ABQ3VPJ5_9CHLR|nr:hypothetical protein KSZ_56120 [Dictyobacter formicarum]
MRNAKSGGLKQTTSYLGTTGEPDTWKLVRPVRKEDRRNLPIWEKAL